MVLWQPYIAANSSNDRAARAGEQAVTAVACSSCASLSQFISTFICLLQISLQPRYSYEVRGTCPHLRHSTVSRHRQWLGHSGSAPSAARVKHACVCLDALYIPVCIWTFSRIGHVQPCMSQQPRPKRTHLEEHLDRATITTGTNRQMRV